MFAVCAFYEHWLALVGRIFALRYLRAYLLCVAGARARPPEDVGGGGGYAHFLEAIGNPAHVEHDELLTWVDGVFDPDGCDVHMIKRQLRRVR